MTRGLSMSGHQRPHRGNTDAWLTPPNILADLGPFDLDPCASVEPPWRTAERTLTIDDDGLVQPWGTGLVWLNPPYGPATWRWLEKLWCHPDGGIALIFARTETRGFVEQVWNRATSLLFLHGRLHFHHADGTRAKANAGAPSVLVAYGDRASSRLHRSRLSGTFVPLEEKQ